MIKRIQEKIPFFSPHYKIERFLISVIMLFTMMVLTFFSSLAKYNKEIRMQITGKTQYSTNVTTSRTGHTGAVEGVYSNSDSTKCFILLKWDDVDTISRKASDYSLFLTGSNSSMGKTVLADAPSSSIYMFGSTGYMGIFLVDATGFTNQIQKLTIRFNQELTSVTQDMSHVSDDSYKEFDMADIYFNPGGSDKIVMNFLNSESITTDLMYYDMVVKDKEDIIREDLNKQLENLQTDLSLVNEYESRLDADEIKWSDTKNQDIVGDTIEMDEETKLYHLDTTHTIGYLDFDWQSGNVHDGYLDDLTTMSFTNYVKSLQSIAQTKSSYTDVVWYKTDGSVFEYDSSTLSSLNAAINTDINNCVTAWTTYYQNKMTYQNRLLDLLTLEHSLNEDWSIYEMVTSLDNESLMTLY